MHRTAAMDTLFRVPNLTLTAPSPAPASPPTESWPAGFHEQNWKMTKKERERDCVGRVKCPYTIFFLSLREY